jgi:hypothetical protein
MNKGGVNPDGRAMVQILPPGNIQISEAMMAEERGLIEQTFLTSLFKTLTQNPNMTATQVVELLNERGMLVAPTLGRQYPEFVGGLVTREIDLLAHMFAERGRPILPPMPPRLREAQGHFEILDTSPLSMAGRASQVAGFMRSVDFARQIAADTGDPSVMDRFDFDTAMPEIAMLYDTPQRWMVDDQKLANKRQLRAKNMARQQQVQAMPAQAAMIKAQAVAQKASGQPPPQQQAPQQPTGPIPQAGVPQ